MEINLEVSDEWRAERASLWSVYERVFQGEVEAGDRDIVNARKVWFTEGNLKPLIELAVEKRAENYELSVPLILELCPAEEVEQYSNFLKEFSSFCSVRKIGWWAPGVQDRNEQAIQAFTDKFSSRQSFGHSKVYEYFFEKLLPHKGIVTFPFPLGDDAWVPSCELNVPFYVRQILYSMWGYLYSRQSFESSSHIKGALPFVSKNIHSISEKVFEDEYLEDEFYADSGEFVNFVGQKCMREIIARLYGYDLSPSDAEEFKCYDLDFEAELRGVFETTQMPLTYYQLLDFIHEHKENCVWQRFELE